MNNRISIFMLLSMISGMIISRPDTITITLGRNVPLNSHFKLQWFNGDQYVSGIPEYNIPLNFKIKVPNRFVGLGNSGFVSTDGFVLTPLNLGILNSKDQKSVQVLFPGSDDRKNRNYEFQLVPRIEEVYSK